MMPVGRSAELGRLDAVLRSATESGRGAVVSVAGAAGVGRSTLLDAMETMAATQGLAVRSVRADRLAQGLPLSVASELMGTDTPVAVVHDGAAHRGFDATPLSHAATAEILQAAERTAEQPTVLVVNDLQWADRWSLLVLGRIAQIALDRPLILVLGVLSTASSQRAEVVDLLSVGQEVTGVRIDLEPLDRTATFELARRHLGGEPGPVLRRMIERSGGSPLLVIELLAAVENRLVRSGGRVDVSSESFPSEVAEVVELRLAGLSASQRTTLSRAAALGSKFSVEDLAAVSASTVLELAPDLTELCRDGLLTERGERLSFVHDLIREAIYAENPPSIRQAMHRDIASVLEAAGAPAYVVAHHLAEGADPGDVHTVDRLIEAAGQLEVSDPVMALSLLSRASEINDREETRTRIDLARAAPLAWTGQLDEASELLVRAIDTHRDPEARAQLRWIRVGMLILANRAPEAVDEASRAAVETRDPVTEARIVSEEALARLASLDPETVSTAHRAMALGESCGDATAIGSALSALARANSSRHGYLEGMQQTRRAVELAENDPTGEAHRMTPWFHHGVMLLDLEDGAGVADTIRHGRERMLDLGNFWADPFYCGLAASLAFREGRLDEATAEALGGIAVGSDTGNVTPVAWCHAIEAHIALYQGDLDAATDHVGQAKQLLRKGLATFGTDFVSRADALLHEANGDLDRAPRRTP